MEQLVKNLPPGFRFKPTDEELVFEYLKNKIYSQPLPTSVIIDINVLQNDPRGLHNDPWDLPVSENNDEKDKYFFTNEGKFRVHVNRKTKSGIWKSTGSYKKIPHSISGHGIEGIRRKFAFYEEKDSNRYRTGWIMHEYCLVLTAAGNTPSNSRNSVNQIGDWVLYHVFNQNNKEEQEEQ